VRKHFAAPRRETRAEQRNAEHRGEAELGVS